MSSLLGKVFGRIFPKPEDWSGVRHGRRLTRLPRIIPTRTPKAESSRREKRGVRV